MKKLLITLLAACLLFSGCSAQPAVKEPDKITFLDIPWGTSDDETVAIIKESFPFTGSESDYLIPGDTEFGYESESTNFSDPEGKYLPVYSSENVRTKEIVLQPHRSSSIFDSVDDYNVSSIYLHFLENQDKKDLKKYELYKASCVFFDMHNEDVEMLAMYFHFQKKLTGLYGEPSEYEQHLTYSFGKGTFRHSVWVADDGTAVYLSYDRTFFSSTADTQENVTINYGTTSVNDVFKGRE